MRIRDFQRLIDAQYGEKDAQRGVAGTFMWFTEEVGELARAIKGDDPANLREEFADVLAWLSTLATLCDVDLEEASGKYTGGCPKCSETPCRCEEKNRFTSPS